MIDPKLFTTVVHAGTHPDPATGAVMTPIYQTSTFAQDAPGKHKGWDYSRGTNPSRDALEQALAALENAEYAIAFSSGLAAEHAIVQNLSAGDHVLVCNDVYGGSGRLFRTLVGKFGIDFEFIDMSDIETVKSQMRGSTKMLWIESPTNPTMQILDIAALSEIAHLGGAITVVDNTFATPLFQRPLELGADIVTHSTTKYIGGHSDLIGGAVMLNNKQWEEKIRYVQFAAGAVSVQDPAAQLATGLLECEPQMRVLDACDQLFDDIQRFEIKVDNISGKLTGNVYLAVVEGNNSHHDFHLQNAIKRFQQRNKGARINIRTGAPNVCERLILDDQVDFGVGLFTRKMPQLDYDWLFSSRIDLYCGKDSPFFDCKEEEINIDEIIAFPHVRRGYFSDNQMPKPHRSFNNQAVASSIEAMSYFLLSGEFLGFLPNHYAQQWVDNGQLRALKTAHFGYNWNFYLAWRKGREFNSTTSAFIKDVQKQANKVEAIASAR